MDVTEYTTASTVDRQRGQGPWTGIFAGLFIAILSFSILSFLGLAIGGHSLSGLSFDALQGISIGAGIWILCAAVAACFLGGYFCSRIVSYELSSKAGMTEGLVISSMFFLAMSVPSVVGVSFVGQGVAQMAGLAAGSSTHVLERPEIQSMLDEAAADLDLEADPTAVISRVGTYLLRGDVSAATNYLANHSNLTSGQINARVEEMQRNLSGTADEIQESAGSALATVGWIAFLTLVLATAGACFGAVIGPKNETIPSRMRQVARSERAA